MFIVFLGQRNVDKRKLILEEKDSCKPGRFPGTVYRPQGSDHELLMGKRGSDGCRTCWLAAGFGHFCMQKPL